MKDESYKNQHIIFLGFAKCGTTFIHKILKQAKEFLVPTTKEKRIYQPSYYDRVKELIEEFGRDKVLLFIMEKDIDLFDDFYERLCKFCEVDYQPYFKNKTMPLVLSGRSLPKCYYADSKDLILECNQTLFKLSEGDLLLSQTEIYNITKDKHLIESALHIEPFHEKNDNKQHGIL